MEYRFTNNGSLDRDIEVWLDALGLDRYLELFTENEIDFDALPLISEADLKELGVALGARRKLLAAISELAETVAPKESGSAENVVTEADRRQLTVMFCDMVGSTALSARIDPEDMRETLRRYTDAVSQQIASHGGHIANYLGDGVLAYFGWPKASEDQAEQAVRAALTCVSTVPSLTTPAGEQLAARAGIATGLVVVGDLEGSAGRQSGAISGETPNLAARLQGEAEPGQVVVGSATAALVDRSFELEALGSRPLKGLGTPVEVYRVVREIANESRFATRSRGGLTPLVGRREELSRLASAWEVAQNGKGQSIVVTGEAGIGKSRTTQELVEHIKQGQHVKLAYQCSPDRVNSSFFPIIQQLTSAYHFEPDDNLEIRLDKLEAALSENVTENSEIGLLIAELMSLPTDRFPALDVPPLLRRQRTIIALVNQVIGLAKQMPVLIIVEDVHWIDPSTLDVFGAIQAAISDLPILLLLTARPEFECPWPVSSHATEIMLVRLSDDQGASLIAKVVSGITIPKPVTALIMERADGNPLYFEEITKSIIETGALREVDGCYELVEPNQELAIPTSLQASLVARLDRLSNIKEVAQIAACIGREFSYELLAAATGIDPVRFNIAIEKLIDVGLIYRKSTSPTGVYIFKHALIQDAAQSTLLHSRRKTIHGEIAAAIEALDPNFAERQPELLANHLAESGDVSRAVDLWLVAGRAAISVAGNREAIGFLNRARKALKTVPSSFERDSLELDTVILTANAYIGAEGYASKGTEEAYLRGRELIENVPIDHRHGAVIYGLFVVKNNHAQHPDSIEFAKELLALAQDQNDEEMLCVAHRSLAVAYNSMGRYRLALDHSEKAVSHHDEEKQAGSAFRYGHDIGVAALWHLALSRLCLGQADAAQEALQTAIDMSRKLDHPTTTAYAGLWNSYFHLMRRAPEDSVRAATALVDYAGKRSMASFEAWGRWMLGAGLIVGGHDYEKALKYLDQSIEDLHRIGVGLLRPSILCYRTEALLALGDIERAEKTANLGLRLCEETGEHWYLPELHRHRAAIFDTSQRKIKELEYAIDIANRQEALLLKTRATVSLANHLDDYNVACKMLAPVLALLEGGGATPDGENARHVLEAMRVSS